MKLGDSVQYLKGVGPRRAAILERAGIGTLEDVLFRLPFRYEDRRRLSLTTALRPGSDFTLLGHISRLKKQQSRRGKRNVLRATFSDDVGTLSLIWFHHADYWYKRLSEPALWMLHGRVDVSARVGFQVVHPELDLIETLEQHGLEVPSQEAIKRSACILPVYQKPAEIPLSVYRPIAAAVVEGLADRVQSPVPESVAAGLGFCDSASALQYVHKPPLDADPALLETSSTPAHRALIFEELFVLQVGIKLRAKAREQERGPVIGGQHTQQEQGEKNRPGSAERDDSRVENFFRTLPFEPTAAQKRVNRQILDDLALPRLMRRLVYGDVGSGKTVVAFAAALQAVCSGFQVAVMAPTELLAAQHLETMKPWGDAEGVTIDLLVGGLGAAAARDLRSRMKEGGVDIVVGTHALVQQGTDFLNLGLAIIDEQHRFGVMQRAGLGSGKTNTLLLSATPIPRTLALTLYADLDVSFLDELPPGRKPVVTRVIRAARRPRLWERMAAVLGQGAQAYIVYPLVEETEKSDLAAATQMAESLQAGPFRSFRVGLLHGRMKAAEKESVMKSFAAGDIDVLVATTVIEVGIDVPGASIMVVEHAERFGLAQLHQLRGRVGRGERESFCCLVLDDSAGIDAAERAGVLERSNNGFEVAEADLKLRGPGEYLGTRQSGIPVFRAANLVRDGELLEQASRAAADWLAKDPNLSLKESAELRRVLHSRFADSLRLAEVG